MSRAETLLVGALAVMVFAYNLTTLSKVDYQLPESVQAFQRAVRLHPTWNCLPP